MRRTLRQCRQPVDGAADAELDKFTWLFFGGGSISLERTLKVPAGAHRKVGFVKPSTLDELQRMIGHQYGDRLCVAKAMVLN